MKKAIVERILKFIRKEAEKGTGRPSSRGLFEEKVPRKLEKKGGQK